MSAKVNPITFVRSCEKVTDLHVSVDQNRYSNREKLLRYILIFYGIIDGKTVTDSKVLGVLIASYQLLTCVLMLTAFLITTATAFTNGTKFDAAFTFKVLFLVIWFKHVVSTSIWMTSTNRRYAYLCQALEEFTQYLENENISLCKERSKSQTFILIGINSLTLFNLLWLIYDTFITRENPLFGGELYERVDNPTLRVIIICCGVYGTIIGGGSMIANIGLFCYHTISILHLYEKLNDYSKDLLEQCDASKVLKIRTLLNKMSNVVSKSNACFKYHLAVEFSATVILELLILIMLADFVASPNLDTLYLTIASGVWVVSLLTFQMALTGGADAVYTEVGQRNSMTLVPTCCISTILFAFSPQPLKRIC